jgi:very-short-patch-repair endonuclease
MHDRDPLLRDRSRGLRQDASDAERLLWQHLRNRQLGETKFRRQRQCGRYILDFYSVEAKLCIEADGSQHYTQAGRRADARRAKYLRDKGIRVIRFSDTEILKDIDGVMMRIFEMVGSAGENAEEPSPPPSPTAVGEGNRLITGRS